MSDHRFDWPSAGASERSIEFPRGARLAGDTPALRLNQETGYSKGGTLRARQYGPAKRVHPVTVIVAADSATETDVEDLVLWITAVAEGALNSFDWSDETGTVRRVRIVNGEFSFPRFGSAAQSCMLQLEEE